MGRFTLNRGMEDMGLGFVQPEGLSGPVAWPIRLERVQ